MIEQILKQLAVLLASLVSLFNTNPAVLVNNNADNGATSTAVATSARVAVREEIEADIFTDLTTVKVEINDVKTTFTTSARTRSAIIDEIMRRFGGLTRSQVDAALSVETEDRASQPEDLQSRNDRDNNRDDDNLNDDRGQDNDDGEDDRGEDNSNDNRGRGND